MVEILEMAISEAKKTDPFFERLFKTKENYYFAGQTICSKYYSHYFNILKEEKIKTREGLQKEYYDLEREIDYLKEVANELKARRKQANEEGLEVPAIVNDSDLEMLVKILEEFNESNQEIQNILNNMAEDLEG